MSMQDMTIDQRLENLLELLECTGGIYRWTYDAEGTLLETNCSDHVLDKVFSVTGCLQKLTEHAVISAEPVLLSIPYGLSWSAAVEKDGDTPLRLHVLGPVTSAELSYGEISKAIRSQRIPHNWRPKLIQILQRIPVVATIDFLRYTLMLQYCVTLQRVTNADVVFYECYTDQATQTEKDATSRQGRMRTYMTEQALMRMITEGDINYKSVLQNAASASRGVQTGRMGSLEQVRVSQIVFISLCTRAAIQGGISPEIAYSRGDAYIQDILDCKTVADAARIGHTMYDDFIHLVHKGRVNPALSPQIQSCCDYIELHAEEKFTLADIARHIGYVEYYLSRKFKAETGYSINNYIKYVKIERAKTLLLATELSIQEICDRLHFGSRSFFAETFKEVVGTPPAAYREQQSR